MYLERRLDWLGSTIWTELHRRWVFWDPQPPIETLFGGMCRRRTFMLAATATILFCLPSSAVDGTVSRHRWVFSVVHIRNIRDVVVARCCCGEVAQQANKRWWTNNWNQHKSQRTSQPNPTKYHKLLRWTVPLSREKCSITDRSAAPANSRAPHQNFRSNSHPTACFESCLGSDSLHSIMDGSGRWKIRCWDAPDAAGWAHNFSFGKLFHHLLANRHADQLTSAQPLLPPSNSIYQFVSPPNPAASPSASMKQVPPTKSAADDSKVSCIIHDSLSPVLMADWATSNSEQKNRQRIICCEYKIITCISVARLSMWEQQGKA